MRPRSKLILVLLWKEVEEHPVWMTRCEWQNCNVDCAKDTLMLELEYINLLYSTQLIACVSALFPANASVIRKPIFEKITVIGGGNSGKRGVQRIAAVYVQFLDLTPGLLHKSSNLFLINGPKETLHVYQKQPDFFYFNLNFQEQTQKFCVKKNQILKIVRDIFDLRLLPCSDAIIKGIHRHIVIASPATVRRKVWMFWIWYLLHNLAKHLWISGYSQPDEWETDSSHKLLPKFMWQVSYFGTELHSTVVKLGKIQTATVI